MYTDKTYHMTQEYFQIKIYHMNTETSTEY